MKGTLKITHLVGGRGRARSLVTGARFLTLSATPRSVPLYTKAHVVREGFMEEKECDLGLEGWMACGWAWKAVAFLTELLTP